MCSGAGKGEEERYEKRGSGQKRPRTGRVKGREREKKGEKESGSICVRECVQVEGRKRTLATHRPGESGRGEKIVYTERGDRRSNDEKWWGSKGERGGGRYSDK